MAEKSKQRQAVEAAGYSAAAAGSIYVARNGIITKRGEFRALLREKAPLEKLERHPHLQRSIAKMKAIPETANSLDFASERYNSSRVFKTDGKTFRGTEALLKHLEAKAPTLGYIDAGMKPPPARLWASVVLPSWLVPRSWGRWAAVDLLVRLLARLSAPISVPPWPLWAARLQPMASMT